MDPAIGSPTQRAQTIHHDGREDTVAVEEPLEIRVDDEPIAVTMRTPGHDEELALGFLYGEGLIDGPREAGPDRRPGQQHDRGQRAADPHARHAEFLHDLILRSLRQGRDRGGHRPQRAARRLAARPLGRELLADLPDRLIQPGFARTGGLHATGLFDAGGKLLCVREDVGRHNAMDKVIGWALSEGLLPLSEQLLCVSGRLSFELVQKAAVAGAPVLVGVGAPTSLAVRAGRGPQSDPGRLRPRRPHQRLQRRTPAQASLKSVEEPFACSAFALTIRCG